jgi:glycosyltransferase involved in cell wall biosynthesis
LKALISIIIPTYNRAHLIGETIASIQKQTYTHWECIIVDDGSTDTTKSVLLDYINKDARISYYKKPKHVPKGPSAARNYGFAKSTGAYINWFDSDDLMHPEKLATDLEHLHSGNFDFTISQSTFFKAQGEPKKKYWNKNLWSKDPINDFIIKKIGWSTNAPLWRRDRLEACNLVFDEDLMTADDFKFHVQAMQFGLKPVIIETSLVSQREHGARLNDYPDKASNKIRTYLYLLKHREALQLNAKTLKYLNWHFLKYYSSLLKAKRIKDALIVLFKVMVLPFKINTKLRSLKLWILGVFYFLTGVGYKFLKTD